MNEATRRAVGRARMTQALDLMEEAFDCLKDGDGYDPNAVRDLKIALEKRGLVVLRKADYLKVAHPTPALALVGE